MLEREAPTKKLQRKGGREKAECALRVSVKDCRVGKRNPSLEKKYSGKIEKLALSPVRRTRRTLKHERRKERILNQFRTRATALKSRQPQKDATNKKRINHSQITLTIVESRKSQASNCRRNRKIVKANRASAEQKINKLAC